MPTHGPHASISAEQRQRAHYAQAAEAYQAHHADQYSMRYRDKFINRFLFDGIPLAGKRVLDGACGSGETTEYLLARGAHVIGLDVSAKMIAAFKARFPRCLGVCASMLSTGLAAGGFDGVAVVGGLHHLHPDVQKAIDEVHRILRPGGCFCFVEPPSGTLPDVVRRRWYRWDKSAFAENEASIDEAALLQRNREKFRLRSRRYGGNIAYLSVFQSLHLRISPALRRLYAPAAMVLESMIRPIQPRVLSCFVICQWQKLD